MELTRPNIRRVRGARVFIIIYHCLLLPERRRLSYSRFELYSELQ